MTLKRRKVKIKIAEINEVTEFYVPNIFSYIITLNALPSYLFSFIEITSVHTHLFLFSGTELQIFMLKDPPIMTLQMLFL